MVTCQNCIQHPNEPTKMDIAAEHILKWDTIVYPLRNILAGTVKPICGIVLG